jgi:hypothetical protein
MGNTPEVDGRSQQAGEDARRAEGILAAAGKWCASFIPSEGDDLMTVRRRASWRLLIVSVCLLGLGVAATHAEKPLVPVNAGQAWRVYDASDKEVGRLVLEQQDPKTGLIQYSTVDPATGTAGAPQKALPWELRDVISAEIAKGDHAVGGYYLDRARMNFSPTVTIKAADLPKPAAAAQGAAGGAPAAEGAAPGPEGAKAAPPKGKGRGKAKAEGAGPGPGGPAAETAAPGPAGEPAPAPEKGGPAAGPGPAGPGGEAAPPPAKGKAKGAGPGGPGGEPAPGEGAPADEGGAAGKLPLIPIAGGVGALIVIVLVVTIVKKRKSAPAQ